MAIGAVILLVGAVVRYFPGAVSWFGNLPGDIRIEREGSRVLIPITSMILLSVALTILANLVGQAFRDR
jgi:hypothetical protein